MRPSARQRVLVDQLMATFLAEGFAAFTLDDLAARLHCSKATLYAIAASKEQLVVRVLTRFFVRATERVEADVTAVGADARVTTYLLAVARELDPVSSTLYADIAAFAPAADLYRRNTELAGLRVQQLITAGVQAGVVREVHAAFVGTAVATVMAAIQSGAISAATGLPHAAAYEELADLVLTGLSPATH